MNYITEEMRIAEDQIKHNDYQIVCIFGPAGTGKTTFLKYLKTKLKNAVFLAPTGVSAEIIGGSTIHKFFNLPVLTNPNIFERQTFDAYKSMNRNDLDLWDSVDYIVIDEISMVRADLIDEIDMRMRVASDSPNDPFGGRHLVFFGDPFQLPPVLKLEDEKKFYEIGYESPYFFSSFTYQKLLAGRLIKHFRLGRNYRQNDAKFLTVLNNIRAGKRVKEDFEYINKRLRIKPKEDCLFITPKRSVARARNISKYDDIHEPECVYMASATGDMVSNLKRALELSTENETDNLPAPAELRLKIGTKIMLLVNESNYVNGTTAYITDLSENLIKAKDGNKEYEISRYTWESKKYVFINGKRELIKTGSYSQFPIMYGWAITIHKSQGKTLNEVLISWGDGAFAPGQVYVALSRVKSIEGLYLQTRLREQDVICSKAVMDYINKCKENDYL